MPWKWRKGEGLDIGPPQRLLRRRQSLPSIAKILAQLTHALRAPPGVGWLLAVGGAVAKAPVPGHVFGARQKHHGSESVVTAMQSAIDCPQFDDGAPRA